MDPVRVRVRVFLEVSCGFQPFLCGLEEVYRMTATLSDRTEDVTRVEEQLTRCGWGAMGHVEIRYKLVRARRQRACSWLRLWDDAFWRWKSRFASSRRPATTGASGRTGKCPGTYRKRELSASVSRLLAITPFGHQCVRECVCGAGQLNGLVFMYLCINSIPSLNELLLSHHVLCKPLNW